MSAGNPDGDCTDCGLSIWWDHNELVTQSGRKWCFGKNESHVGMNYRHALPGMAQWIAPSPLGQVCHCLDRKDAHIHQITEVPLDGQLSDSSALDKITEILRANVGAGWLLATARIVRKTGRDTGWNLGPE